MIDHIDDLRLALREDTDPDALEACREGLRRAVPWELVRSTSYGGIRLTAFNREDLLRIVCTWPTG